MLEVRTVSDEASLQDNPAEALEASMPFMLDERVAYEGATSFTTTGTHDNVDGADNT